MAIQIYSDLVTGMVNFEGARQRAREIGSVVAELHPIETDRIIIKSNQLFKAGSDTEYRVFFRRLKITRIENEAGQRLTEAPLNMDRDAVLVYLNDQFTVPIVQEYFKYDATSDRLVAQKDIQVNKNGFFLGGKHKMASGNSNIYFEDLDTKTNSYPIFGELLDQSLAANQLAGEGFNKPKTRIFQDFQSIPLGGTPVNDTAIGYDGDNFFPFNISGVGITTRAGEVVAPTQKLKYEIIVNGISVYVQYLEHGGFAINDDITWYFEQPLDIEAGTTLRATIYKISTVDNQEVNDGVLQVCEGSDTPVRYQTNVLNRFFTDEPIALKSEVDALLTGSTYKGSYDGASASPTLPTGSDVLGDFYRVTVAGGGYATGDILVYNGTDYDHVAADQATSSDIKNSGLKIHDIYVKAGYAGLVKDGSVLYPYDAIETAIGSANDGDSIYLEGSFEIASEITMPADKSLYLYGSDDAAIGFTAYDAANGSLLRFTGTDSTKELKFKNITFKNAGGYGLYVKKAAKIEIDDCVFTNNGWNGTALNTIMPSTLTALLGYDSSSADLQAFYAGPNASNGGAMRLEEITTVLITANTVTKNLRGIRVQDCGVGGAGVITRNQVTENIESGIYIAAGGTYYGSQNITVSMNVSGYNANNGLLTIGGINNKFSQNEVKGNWNAGACFWGSANTTLRDCGLYDNNRSQYNGIGNSGDAKASIQINEAYNLLGTSISLNPAARFIAEILDTQVHYTGLGSNTEKIGFIITSGVGSLADNDKNIIKVDDVGFIGQDYAIDLSEVDVSNLRLSFGDNSYQSIGIAAVKPPAAGNYSELPFSNHIMAVPSVDVVVDTLNQTIALKEYVSGNIVNTYAINELQGVDMGTHVDIIQKSSDRIQLRGLTFGNVYVNGVQAGTDVNSMNNTLNAAFQMDLTQYKNFLVSEVGVNGDGAATLPAQADNWYIAYGARAEEQMTTAGVVADVKDLQPFYNGDFLEKGHEYVWSHYDDADYMIGLWSGSETVHDEGQAVNPINWSIGFFFDENNDRFNPDFCAGVDLASRYSTGYTMNSNKTLALRYGNDGYLYLLDITGGTDLIIARSNVTLIDASIPVFFAGENQPNAQFPVMQERTERWTIVADFDDSEGGEWIDGIENQTIIKSNMYLEPGEKFTFDLPSAGLNKHYGLSYTGAATGESNPISGLQDGVWRWDAQEIIHNMVGWSFNTAAAGYGRRTLSPTAWGVIDGQIHTVSYRHLSDNTLEMWSEDENELIMTYNVSTSGTPIHLFFGANQSSSPYSAIPALSKYDMTAVEEGTNIAAWYYIESPDGTFIYPLYETLAEATATDAVEGGSGTAQGYSFPDDPTGKTWYGPDTSFISNGTLAPSHGVYGNSTNVLWNEIATNADSTAAPTAFTNAVMSLDELTALNFQIHPVDAAFTTTIQSAPSWVSQATNNANITGTAPAILGDNTSFPSVDHTVTVVRTNAYGSSTGTLTITVNNLTTPASLPGTLHAGSIVDSSAANSAGKIYLQLTGGHVVYDFPTALADGDKLEWYHQDGSYIFGIAAAGVDKTTDLADHDADNSAKWDLAAPITGSPTHTNGQNFGNNFSSIHIGMVPLGWDDNTNPQVIPTRPVYAASDVWKLYNNAGTIELSLNGVLFRSSSSTHTDPVITFAVSEISGSGGVATYSELPTFIHTADAALAPSGFTMDHGSMDTSSLLNGDSTVILDNLTLSPGQRLVVNKSWIDTNVLPHIDGASGEDNKVYIGAPKPAALGGALDINDFWATLRVENQTSNLVKYTKHYTGPFTSTENINRFSDTDSNLHFGIEFTREGDIVTLWSPDSDPSLTTEPITGTIGHVQTWSNADATIGSSALDLAIATKGSETRASLSESGLSVITAPSKANEFDVTENASNEALFNGSAGTTLTLAAGTTYKFWMHSDTIESTDTLEICLTSDNSTYTTGVTTAGTPGTFGAYLEFAVPADVPPVKFKWTSGGVAYYSAPTISGSTYSASVTGVTLLGPSGDIAGNVMSDDAYLEVDETIAAGQRIVFNNAFLTDLAAEMVDGDAGNQIHIGLKGSATVGEELGEFTSMSAITLPATYTVNIWVKNATVDGTQQWSNLLYQTSGTKYLLDAEYGRIGNNQVTSSRLTLSAAAPLVATTDTWHMVTVVYNGTNLAYYVDGTIIGTATPGAMPSQIDSVNSPSGQEFAEAVKDLRVYDFVASQAQITGSFSDSGIITGFSDSGTIQSNIYDSRWIRFRNNGGTYQLTLFENSTQIANQDITSPFTDVSAFIELTASGNNIRFGIHDGSSVAASTTAYADWTAGKKMQTGDQGYGLSSAPIIMRFVHAGGTFDAADVDWTELSEISTPSPAPSNSTDWDKAIDFSGSNEHMKLVSNQQANSPLRMASMGYTTAAPLTAGHTSNDALSRPWATAIVFKTDHNSSNQHIWNSGEGATSNDDNIYLRVSAGKDLIFGWGRGSNNNECVINNMNFAPASKWWGVYIAHTGERLSAANATAANLADCFDIRLLSDSTWDSTSTLAYQRSITSNWTSNGHRMDRAVMGDFTIGGRGSNRNFHGKVASMVVTTLMNNVAMPTDAEIKKMITDPKGWVTDYKLGNSFMSTSQTGGGSMLFPSSVPTTNYSAIRSTQVWLMGEGTSDSFSNGIRNYIQPTDQNNTKMQFNSMSSNDIETVTIPGLP